MWIGIVDDSSLNVLNVFDNKNKTVTYVVYKRKERKGDETMMGGIYRDFLEKGAGICSSCKKKK